MAVELREGIAVLQSNDRRASVDRPEGECWSCGVERERSEVPAGRLLRGLLDSLRHRLVDAAGQVSFDRFGGLC